MSSRSVHPIFLMATQNDWDAVAQFIQQWGQEAPSDVALVVLGVPRDHRGLQNAVAAYPLRQYITEGSMSLQSHYLYSPAGDVLFKRVQDGTFRGEVHAFGASTSGEVAVRQAEELLISLTTPAILVFFNSMIPLASKVQPGLLAAGAMVILETADALPAHHHFDPDSAVAAGHMFSTALAYIDFLPALDDTCNHLPTSAQIEQIAGIVSRLTDVDFSEYKTPTLGRRIQRRMKVCSLEAVSDYIEFLDKSDIEIHHLHQEMLIGVTRFFRDPDAFESLRSMAIAGMVARASEKNPIRIWIAGCSTGEEVYSLAILLAEEFERVGKRMDVRYFATDLDKSALAIASAGIYDGDKLGKMSRERMGKYFTKHLDCYQIASVLRELIIFAPHNMIKDPPFHRLDLITCRNVLIYLKPAVQQRLLGTFHFSLNPEGFLLLGRSEQVGDMANCLNLIDPTEKIFQKNASQRAPITESSSLLHHRSWRHAQVAWGKSVIGSKGPDTLLEAINQTLLQEFILNFLVVDDSFEIRHVSGDMSRYLVLPQGKPNLNIIKMVSPAMSIALSTGIRQSIAHNETVIFDNVSSVATSDPGVRVVIRPFLHRKEFGRLAVIVFESAQPGIATSATSFNIDFQSSQRIHDLELELENTSQSLSAALEELETSNEEMQATNEEVLAANEELQSANEELHSVNEELNSVNNESKAKISDLSALNNDILSSLTSSSIGTIFLDKDLRVRKFTKSATRQVNLIETDIGRPLEHLTNNILYPSMVQDARKVLQSLIPIQSEVYTTDGEAFTMRIVPYRAEDDSVKGIVITFVDISSFTPFLSDTNPSSKSPHQVSMVLISDTMGKISYINEQVTILTGWSLAELDHMATNHPALVSESTSQDTYRDIRNFVSTGRSWSGAMALRHRDGRTLQAKARFLPIGDGQGVLTQVLVMGALAPDMR